MFLIFALFIISLNKTRLVALIDGDEIFVRGIKSVFNENNIPLTYTISDFQIEESFFEKVGVLIIDPYKSSSFDVNLLSSIINKYPTLKVLVITAIANKHLVDEVIDLGVNAVLFKCCKTEEFVRAYFKAIKGESHYCSSIKEKCDIQKEKLDGLTDREVEVVNLVCEGMTTQEIADFLNRSTHTINTHRKNILKKLNVKSPLELIKLMSEQ